LCNRKIQWHFIQKDCRPEEQEFLHRHPSIVDLHEEINDFEDTAAILEILDGLISVDTSVAHLAGALHRPVNLLLPCNPDWRWMLNRDDSPWYPDIRIFRRAHSETWTDLIERLSSSLPE